VRAAKAISNQPISLNEKYFSSFSFSLIFSFFALMLNDQLVLRK